MGLQKKVRGLLSTEPPVGLWGTTYLLSLGASCFFPILNATGEIAWKADLA